MPKGKASSTKRAVKEEPKRGSVTLSAKPAPAKVDKSSDRKVQSVVLVSLVVQSRGIFLSTIL
uniref:Uncharacterized protein n=1 Tax=Equus caballus TaxID=9796 RepID=A0A9L0S8F8_HORSE